MWLKKKREFKYFDKLVPFFNYFFLYRALYAFPCLSAWNSSIEIFLKRERERETFFREGERETIVYPVLFFSCRLYCLCNFVLDRWNVFWKTSKSEVIHNVVCVMLLLYAFVQDMYERLHVFLFRHVKNIFQVVFVYDPRKNIFLRKTRQQFVVHFIWKRSNCMNNYCR